MKHGHVRMAVDTMPQCNSTKSKHYNPRSTYLSSVSPSSSIQASLIPLSMLLLFYIVPMSQFCAENVLPRETYQNVLTYDSQGPFSQTDKIQTDTETDTDMSVPVTVT